MLDLAGLISENIDNCFELFPDWVNWNYIKDLFVIPQYTKKGVLKSEFNIYMKNIEKHTPENLSVSVCKLCLRKS